MPSPPGNCNASSPWARIRAPGGSALSGGSILAPAAARLLVWSRSMRPSFFAAAGTIRLPVASGAATRVRSASSAPSGGRTAVPASAASPQRDTRLLGRQPARLPRRRSRPGATAKTDGLPGMPPPVSIMIPRWSARSRRTSSSLGCTASSPTSSSERMASITAGAASTFRPGRRQSGAADHAALQYLRHESPPQRDQQPRRRRHPCRGDPRWGWLASKPTPCGASNMIPWQFAFRSERIVLQRATK
jgi:hypothetical protein